MSSGTTLLISDIHTNFDVVNAQIEHARTVSGGEVERVFVLGDFGFFGDQLHDFFRRRKARFALPVGCIEGNHEDYGALHELAKRYIDCFAYSPRGTICDLGAWTGLCLGGARYMDAWSTPRGCEITVTDIERCLTHESDAADLVLSHDCPTGIGVPNTPGLEHYGVPGVPMLRRVAEHFRPRWWFFGHHHKWFDLERDGTRFVGLPQSWLGYVLLHADGEITKIEHEVPIERRSRWKRWFGLR